MAGDWLQRVASSIPRGFSRYYVLELLMAGPHTGKQIIDAAAAQSGGRWRPSPGLIYPLLGRLLEEGLLEEGQDGRYQITKRGRATAEDIEAVNRIVRNQLEVLMRVRNVGSFVVQDLIERMRMMGSVLGQNASRMTPEEVGAYRGFLESEIRRLDERQDQGKQISID